MSPQNNKPRNILPEHKEELERIGNRLKELKKEKEEGENITYTKLAKDVGVSRNNYYLVESGKVYFKIDMLISIIKYFNLSLVDFFKSLE